MHKIGEQYRFTAWESSSTCRELISCDVFRDAQSRDTNRKNPGFPGMDASKNRFSEQALLGLSAKLGCVGKPQQAKGTCPAKYQRARSQVALASSTEQLESPPTKNGVKGIGTWECAWEGAE